MLNMCKSIVISLFINKKLCLKILIINLWMNVSIQSYKIHTIQSNTITNINKKVIKKEMS